MARVGIDLDGVVVDFVDAYRKHCLTHQDYGSMPEPKHWNFYKDAEWGSRTTTQFKFCLETYGHQIFANAEPYPGAEFDLLRLLDAGHTLVFITDRSIVPNAREITREWINRKMPDVSEHHYELHITADKASISVDYFIDDKPENLTPMPYRTSIFLCKRPWNTGSHIRRSTLEAFVDHVLDKESPFIMKSNGPMTIAPEEVRITSPTGGQKGKKLARFDLIPPRALRKVAEIYGKGAEKYDDWNWRKGYDWSLSIAALERHFQDFKDGNSYHEDGHSLASVVFHALALMTFEEEHPELDDRFKRPE